MVISSRIHDVGVIMDLATHDLDIMRFLTHSEAVRAIAETGRQVHPSYEDMFAGMVRFASGAWRAGDQPAHPRKDRELYVTGERGMFYVDAITQDLRFSENAETNGDDWAALSLLRWVKEGPETKPSAKENRCILS